MRGFRCHVTHVRTASVFRLTKCHEKVGNASTCGSQRHAVGVSQAVKTVLYFSAFAARIGQSELLSELRSPCGVTNPQLPAAFRRTCVAVRDIASRYVRSVVTRFDWHGVPRPSLITPVQHWANTAQTDHVTVRPWPLTLEVMAPVADAGRRPPSVYQVWSS